MKWAIEYKLRCQIKHLKCDKVLKNGPSKTCGRHPLKNLKGYSLITDHIPSYFVKMSSTNSTWSILEYFVPHVSSETSWSTAGFCRQIFWVYLTILWGWRLKGQRCSRGFIQFKKHDEKQQFTLSMALNSRIKSKVFF